ncbi:tail fiber protein [Flavobacterium sp. Root186]|uniref:tail fiber protein n=1 Tax=Flavobacterium sp. Root186 TaxID=1736485 RepID=UPI0006F5471F|nr:tail fiber protein [Flavobacterium sp. Root186]KRB56700.1 hypothetical protein ASD98_08390 [Flavobacterium sp. Root186]
MKKLLTSLILLISIISYGQVSGNFVVNGDLDKFYPVKFIDGGWGNNVPTNLILGRSNVHTNASWRGSLMATFNFHTTAWGNGSNFIDAEVKPLIITGSSPLIAGWQDITAASGNKEIIIWIRGGATTYYYQSNYAVNPVVYDEVQNPLPFNIINGGQLTFKTAVDTYATTTGTYQSRNAYFTANVGIGTLAPDEKLTVKGKIHTQEVRVDMLGPLVPDYVFKNDYKLKTLEEVENYIKENKHLPEVPSAIEIEKNGLMLAEMNMTLLKKIEEMTLYLIEQEKKNNKQSDEIEILKKENETFKSILERLTQLEQKIK